jgi:hypothetical protein
MDPGIACELPVQILREMGIQFEKKKMRCGMHAAHNFAGMDALAGAIFRDQARPTQIHPPSHPIDKRLGAGNDGGDLKWPLQESLKEQDAHGVANFNL